MTTKRKPRDPPTWHSKISTPVKTLGGIVVALGVILGGAIAVDERFAHAGDLKQLNANIEINRLTGEVSVLQIRRSQLSDRIYDTLGKVKGRPTPEQDASLQRSKEEAVAIDREIEVKRRALERLRTGQ